MNIITILASVVSILYGVLALFKLGVELPFSLTVLVEQYYYILVVTSSMISGIGLIILGSYILIL